MFNACASYKQVEKQNIKNWTHEDIEKSYNDTKLYAICYENPPLPTQNVGIIILDSCLTSYVIQGSSSNEVERKSKTMPCDPKVFTKSLRKVNPQPWQFKRMIELVPGQYCIRLRTVRPADSMHLSETHKTFKSLGFDFIDFDVKPGHIYWINKTTQRFYYLNKPYHASLLEVEQWIPEMDSSLKNKSPLCFRKEVLETVHKTREQYTKMLSSEVQTNGGIVY